MTGGGVELLEIGAVGVAEGGKGPLAGTEPGVEGVGLGFVVAFTVVFAGFGFGLGNEVGGFGGVGVAGG